MTKTSVIDATLNAESGYDFRAGPHCANIKGLTDQDAAAILAFARRCYALGRSDARAEVAATLRGLLSA